MAAALHRVHDQRHRPNINNSSRHPLPPSPLASSVFNALPNPHSPPHIMQPPLHPTTYYSPSFPSVPHLSLDSSAHKLHPNPSPSDRLPPRYAAEPPLPPPHFLPHHNLHPNPAPTANPTLDHYPDQVLLDPAFPNPSQVHASRQQERRHFFESSIAPLPQVQQQPLVDIPVASVLPSQDARTAKIPPRLPKDLSVRELSVCDHPQPSPTRHPSQHPHSHLPPLPPHQSALRQQPTPAPPALLHKTSRHPPDTPQPFSLSAPDVSTLPIVDDSSNSHPAFLPVSPTPPPMFVSDANSTMPTQYNPQPRQPVHNHNPAHLTLALQSYTQAPHHPNLNPMVYSVSDMRPPAQAPSAFAQPTAQQVNLQTTLQTEHNPAAPVAYVHQAAQQPGALMLNPLQSPVDHGLPQTMLPSPDLGIHPLVQNGGSMADMMGGAMPVSAVLGTVGGCNMISVPELVGAPQLAVNPEILEMCTNVGRVCRDIGRLDLAASSFRACMTLCPESNEARAGYTAALYGQGFLESGLDTGPVFPEDVFNNVGNALRTMGRTTEAEMAYRAALNIAPKHAQAWNNLGIAMRARGALVDAMSCYTASLSFQPGFAAAHCNLAGLLRDQGKPQEAEAQYRAALLSDPNLAEAAAGLGTALRDMGRTEEAVSFYKRAVLLQPDAADHHANLANTYKDVNRIEESIGSYQAALSLQPDLPDAFCNMVHSLSVICDWRNRERNFATLLAIVDRQLDSLMNHPATTPRLYNTLVGALSNSTPHLVDVCGGSRSEFEGGSPSGVASREENSNDRRPQRRYIHHPSSPTVVRKARMRGKFAKFVTSAASVVAPVLSTGLPSVQPFHALIYPMSPEKFKALSAAYAARAEAMVAGISQVTQRWMFPKGSRARLKVGYVSSDYNNHPYSHLTQSIYGLHRTGLTVECYCYALTPSDQSAWRHRIEKEAEHFRDISSMSAKQSAETIANDGIHVLVNCNGYTKGARTELFALRPAPVQVSFMGFPGTLGAHFIEYFITDVVTSPPELASRMHSEALLYHPHSYFVNDHRQTSIPGPLAYPTGPLTRAHYGLPENCFLYMMHNQLYKLSPDTFDVWARILKRVPGSKLWLLRFPPAGEQRIRDEAVARGLAADRLIFTDVAGKEEHVARAGLGDLFLDTPTCNAHTTGTDALWSGVPMITCPGSLFASRVAASLLTAAGVPELIAKDMLEYEDLAVELATNRGKLDSIRARIEHSRNTNALFDTERWVRNVEALYWRAWENFADGNGPIHIFGTDVYDGSTMLSRPAAVESHYSATESRHSETFMHGNMFNSTIAT
eukprot:GFKZ01014308.1.p1 GENE.GFKZ01014308.1~~GFKZ01014308.1.p1  ORF type:complete len:1308 (-),score=154.88 GFKZ01014308.1:458-4381(-)